jgi:hypothetical protein
MTIVVPGLDEVQQRIVVEPTSERDGIAERYKRQDMHDLLVLQNKQPQWNEESQTYVLNFHGRVTHSSVKNFQIVHEGDRALRFFFSLSLSLFLWCFFIKKSLSPFFFSFFAFE